MIRTPAKRLSLALLVIVLVALFALPVAAGSDAGADGEKPYITEPTTPPSTSGIDVGVGDVVNDSADTHQAAATEVAGETLPFTGGDVVVIAAVGVGLVAAGFVLVAARRSRPDPTT